MSFKRCFWLGVVVMFLFTIPPGSVFSVYAEPPDVWWDAAWPYRMSVNVSDSGPTGVHLDFSSLFEQLGLVGALLDLRSIRVVPVVAGVPLDPIPYQETYSTSLIDGESLNLDSGEPEPYWQASGQTHISLDTRRFTEGSSAIHAEIITKIFSDPDPGFSFYFNGQSMSDWSAYESLVYQVWPEVNASALDQSPDIYQFEILGLGGCYFRHINGPAMRLGAWNSVSVSLRPFSSCTTPNYSTLNGLRFYLETENQIIPGADFEDGDEVQLWLDAVRLVDQDGPGEIRWVAEEGVTRYDIYFDSLAHSGHPEPALTTVGAVTPGTAAAGRVESGGYFHQIAGADAAGMTIWNAPPVEKILKTQAAPTAIAPLRIHAGRGEYELVQLVVQSDHEADYPISISDLVNGDRIIPASRVSLFRVDYLSLSLLSDEYGRLTDWPDPLYPLSQHQTVHLPAGENQPIWIEIEVPPGTAAGDYIGTIRIGPAQVPFTLTVLDVSVSKNAMLPVVAGIDWDSLLTAYGAAQVCRDQARGDLSAALVEYGLTPVPLEAGSPAGLIYSLTDYQVTAAHQAQIQTGEDVWWTFTGWDEPPLPNPAVMDRTGLEARILPWLAWADRVDGLYYAQANDWNPDPWNNPFSNDLSNGDGFLIYPPNDDTLAYNPCDPNSNRLVPSIRLLLLREGLEDYAYLYRLNSGPPRINVENEGDFWAATMIGSRTDFLRPPTEITDLRLAIADTQQAKQSAYYFPLIFR